MKAGASWPATTVKAGGPSALVAGGCRSPDHLSGPEWTSATPAFCPSDIPPPAHDSKEQWGKVHG